MSAEPRPELGVECSCGFKRRATQITQTEKELLYNGREIEGLHFYEIEKERIADVVYAAAGNPLAVRVHRMSMGLIADLAWPALTEEEQTIGSAYWIGYWRGHEHMRGQIQALLEERLAALRTR